MSIWESRRQRNQFMEMLSELSGLVEGLRKGNDKMTKTLAEMPEVGEKVRYVGGGVGFFTKGLMYEITSQNVLEVTVTDDAKDIHHLTLDYLNSNFDVGTQSLPDVRDLIANLGRRLHEVEQYLADEEAEQYPDDDDDVVTELSLEPGVRDAVSSPSHYTQGDIEVIDYIDQVADGYYGKQAVYAGNIIKYVSRAPYKNGIEDAKKAAWYLSRLIDAMETEETEAYDL